MNPAIVIGLGGTGLEVLMFLRRKVVQRFGSLQNLPILGYLHIDTDQSLESQAMPSTQYLGEDIGLVESERLHLTVAGGESWKDNQTVRDWFPDGLPIPSNFRTGCAAQRNFGRLAFCANVDQIRERINNLAPRVTDPQMHAALGVREGMPIEPNLDVFIACSLLGGTGSGMVYDLCYTARHALPGYRTLFHGYLITGGPTAQDDQKANCYAALMELDHYNSQGFRMRYPGALLPEIQSTEGPLDWGFLVNGINASGVAFSRQVVWESVAESIFAEILPGLRDRRQTVRDNIRDAGYGEPDRLGKPQRYLSFGMASIEFPALNLQDALSYRLAGEALAHWHFAQAPREDPLKRVDQDVTNWRLETDLLVEELLQDDAGVSQLRQIAERTSEQKRDCTEDALLEKGRREDLREKVEACLRNNDADVEPHPSVAHSGARIRQAQHRRVGLLDKASREAIAPRVLRLVGDEHGGGIANALGYLDALEKKLKGIVRDCQGREDRYRREADRAYGEKVKRLQVFREEYRESRYVVRRHVDAVLNASAHYQEMRVNQTANEMARLLIVGRESASGAERGLLAELDAWRRRIADYRERLDTLSGVCNDQYEKRKASIVASSGLADVMITEPEIQAVYGASVPDPLQVAAALKNEVEGAMGREVFTAILEFPDATREALVRRCKERFTHVRDTSVADRLIRLSPVERDNKIQTLNRNAQALVQVDGERRQRYCNITAPERTQGLMIGTAPPDEEPALAVGGALRRALEAQVAVLPESFVQALPDRSRLLFTYEMGVFSLHCLRDLADYRKIYRKAQARQRHTHKGIAFPDLFPPEDEEVRTRAERAMVLGRAMELFRSEPDPETGDEAIYYYYLDRHGRHPVKLGRDWPEVEQALFTALREKVVLATVEGTTTLEWLEAHLQQLGHEAKTRSEKERLWTRLQGYLDARERELEGGLRHARHQRESRWVNAYRDSYDLTPPLVASSATTATSPSVSDTPTPARSADGSGFRLRARDVAASGGLTDDARRTLLREASRFGLGFGEAKRIIGELGAPGEPAEPVVEPAARYSTVFAELWRDTHGQLDPDHREYLEGLQRELALTEEQVERIQAAVAGQGDES